MSALTDQFEADLIAIEGEIELSGTPTLITWNGQTYPCRAGHRTESDELGEGGLERQISQTVWVRKSLFTDGRTPFAGNRVDIDNRKTRVLEVAPTQDGVDVRLTLFEL
jgi:hypothetical protein